MSLTRLERMAIQGILDSDYMDGDTLESGHAVNRPVWTWSANPFPNKRTFSGVVASLVKKGYVVTEGHREDDCIYITEAGAKAFLEPEEGQP